MNLHPDGHAGEWDNQLVEHYRIFRDYVEHEDDLINHRSTWHHTIQGLLFTALGITLNWKPEPGDPRATAMRVTLTFLLPLMGIAISVAAYLSIRAASIALDELRYKWCTFAKSYPAKAWASLPDLTGAGHQWALKFGKSPAYAIPFCIGVAWLILLLVQFAALLFAPATARPPATPAPACCCCSPVSGQAPKVPPKVPPAAVPSTPPAAAPSNARPAHAKPAHTKPSQARTP